MTLPLATIGPLLAPNSPFERSPIVGFPDRLAGARVERDQMRLARRDEDLVVVHRDAAHRGRDGLPPYRFSQISSPVFASSACMMLPALLR